MYENQMRLHDAIVFAVGVHRGQKGKETDVDAIVHPLEVLSLVVQASPRNIDLQIAAVLHDTVEDCGVTLTEIRHRFGGCVADYVDFVSEDKSKPWRERKQDVLADLQEAAADEMILACADLLSDLRSMAADYSLYGEELWLRDCGSKEDIRRSCRNQLTCMKELSVHVLTRDLFSEARVHYETLFHETFYPRHWR